MGNYGTRACEWCGDEMSLFIRRDVERKRFCSHACRQRWRFANGEWNMTGIRKKKGGRPDRYKPRTCETCIQVYEPANNNQRWCRTCAPNVNWSRRIARYGVTLPMWDAMLATQNGLCAICGEKPPTDIDHDHVTGKVRGLLCSYCNHRLHAIENRGWLQKAEVYLAV
jgi:hypothetical protein